MRIRFVSELTLVKSTDLITLNDKVLKVIKSLFHLSLVLNQVLNHLNSHDLLSGDVVYNLVTLLILLSLLVGHLNLEPLDSRCDTQPHGILLLLQFLIDSKEDNLVRLLVLEHVHDLETFLIVLCLSLVVVHWEIAVVLLV